MRQNKKLLGFHPLMKESLGGRYFCARYLKTSILLQVQGIEFSGYRPTEGIKFCYISRFGVVKH